MKMKKIIWMLNKAIRIEMHEDKALIANLENSIVEADIILQSLNDKAKFSEKLEKERHKMIKDRSVLLKDLCTTESVKYRRKTSTLPSYLDPKVISNPDGSKFENITNKVKNKLFTCNNKLKHQSPESYKKRESIFKRIHGSSTARNKSQNYLRLSVANLSSKLFEKHFQ